MVMINIDDVNLINNINNVKQKNLSRIQLPETSNAKSTIENRDQEILPEKQYNSKKRL